MICLRKERIMRFKIVSLLGFLAVLPAFGAARLPAVNVNGDGVSARSAFGDNEYSRGNVSYAPTRRVVSRAKTQNPGITYSAKKTDYDILSPNLPSSNLWAENAMNTDEPLRMPRADEVAIFNATDFDLPDENIEVNYTADATPVSRSDVAFELQDTMNRMAQIDAKIAKLEELQRRANNSVKQNPVRSQIAKNNVPGESTIHVSRTVVPMDDEPDILIRSVEKHSANNNNRVAKTTPRINDNLANLSPTELRKAFRKTFLSENKHLSAMRDTYADEYDTRESFSKSAAGFTAETNLSEMGGGIRPFEIKISFRNFDSALSRENYTLLTTFAGIVVNDPKRAVQVLIPNDATTDSDNRKLTARRLAIVEQVLRDTGVPEQRILPVLSNREDDGGLVLRNIDSTQYETLTKQQRSQFGKTTNKTYKSMSW